MKIFKTKWGKWVDLSTGRLEQHKYLLQARRHMNGKVEFRIARADSAYGCDKPTLEQLKSVKQ